MTDFAEIRTEEQLLSLAGLAREIWTECYTDLLGPAQVAYMLETIQSEGPMRRQMERDGYRYFFLRHSGRDAGYLGVQQKDGALFLSKLYVRAAARGQGTARDVMAFLEGWARGAHLRKIWLTVNRGNAGAIAAYKRLGFLSRGPQDSPIGHGYVMEDYVLERNCE